MKPLSSPARAFIAATIICGCAVMFMGLYRAAWPDLGPFFCYFVLAILASGIKVKLPGVTGAMSVVFLFILIGIRELSIGETLMIGLAGALVQSYWNTRPRPKAFQVLFNVASMSTAVGVAAYAYRASAGILRHSPPPMLILAATVFFVLHTAPASCIMALTEGRSLRKIWSQCYFW